MFSEKLLTFNKIFKYENSTLTKKIIKFSSNKNSIIFIYKFYINLIKNFYKLFRQYVIFL